jgi:hypothetical protein
MPLLRSGYGCRRRRATGATGSLLLHDPLHQRITHGVPQHVLKLGLLHASGRRALRNVSRKLANGVENRAVDLTASAQARQGLLQHVNGLLDGHQRLCLGAHAGVGRLGSATTGAGASKRG